MSTPILGSIVKYLGKAVESSRVPGRLVAIAVLRTAETLGDMLLLGAMTDFARIREALIQRTEAETASVRADAEKKLADAAEAANKSTLHLRTDAAARIEQEIKEVAVEKIRVETWAIKTDAETRRIKELAEAKAKLLVAVAQLRSEGGDLLLSRENIEKILAVEGPDDKTVNTAAIEAFAELKRKRLVEEAEATGFLRKEVE